MGGVRPRDRDGRAFDDDAIDGPVDTWRAIRDEIHEQVCERGYNAKLGAFVQSYDDDRLDASVLMIPLVGFLPGDDPRVASTIDAIDRELTVDGLRAAVRPAPRRRRDRRAGGRVPRVQLLDGLRARRDRPARRSRGARSSGCSTLANDVGLFSEEYDPVNRRMLGNFPQAFTHLALVDAAQDLLPHETRRDGGDRPDRDRATGSVREIGRRRRPVACPPWLS